MVGMPHHKKHDSYWSRLAPDLLQLICKNILDISDFVRFRAVCKDWRMAIHLSDYSQQPCLFNADILNFNFYTLNSTQWTKFEIVSNFKEKTVLGSSQGYMLIRDVKTWSHYLLNPITGNEIQLPLHDYYLKLLDVELEEGVPKYVAVFTCELIHLAAFVKIYRIEDEKLTMVYQECTAPDVVGTFYKSSIYITSSYDGKVIDRKPGIAMHRMSPPTNMNPFRQCRPCGIASGLLLLEINTRNPECLFEIYRLDDENGSARWIKTNNIGGLVVFWTWTSCICLETNNSGLYKRNSVYYRSSKRFGRFDIENATAEILQSPPPIWYSWFLPSLV
ncbi:F-box domain-containing protein [Rhynchospora pubera]|uniref:F-box domain-containing protein n=1 Tax=Rhynchospora pubera TaxID=906938 RepID=A0AAV8H672_9POAL|nr:F-box domain-containing protein [Rhynchospora pubera]